MNLRTLKKLSKRALPILLDHYRRGLPKVFLAVRGDNYHGLIIRCRHYRSGSRDDCRICTTGHPLKGTPMLGEMSGGEEPEWSEKTAWEWLREFVTWSDQPATMTDAEWAETLKIARAVPVTQEEIDAMLAYNPELEEAA